MVNLTKRLVLISLGISCLRAADDQPKQKAQVTATEHAEFAAGGTLHVKNSIGELDVEGWDQSGVEITTIKSSKRELDSREREQAAGDLARVRTTLERHGSELDITSTFPKHEFLTRFFRGETDFDLEYHIKAPRNARVVIDHDIGEVYIDDMTSDIHVTNHMGDILLHLPQDNQYSIDAKSKIGDVNSDFPGHNRHKLLFGHFFSHEASTAPKLYLRIGFGDIIILKIRKPATPAPLAASVR